MEPVLFIRQPCMYHGDEIEVSGDEPVWTAKKTLHILKYAKFFCWRRLFFLLELKVDNKDITSHAGIFIDEAGEPAIEIEVSAAGYEVFERELGVDKLSLGSHLIELKLKSEGTRIYNRLLEIWIA